MRAVRRAARAAGLIHGADDQPGYGRRGRPGRFHYVDTRGRRLRDARALRRIVRLAIPPAWTQVWINRQPRGHLQASGRDARGRKQYVYHPDWHVMQAAAKYDDLIAFATALPRLRRAVGADLRRPRLDRRCVTAVVVRLLETSLIRIGNDEYARTNHSYGLTTLRVQHVRTTRRGVHFRFRGKSGQRQAVDVARPRLARLVRRIQELPGQELFHYLDADGRSRRLRSDEVNAYVRAQTGGDFTARHFRTWAGTVLAACALAQQPTPASARALRAAVMTAVREVAARLGNTAAVARRSYIHPAVIAAFAGGGLPRLPRLERWPPGRCRPRLTPEERRVLRLLAAARTRAGR
jgi:DNA topoisomerase-1